MNDAEFDKNVKKGITSASRKELKDTLITLEAEIIQPKTNWYKWFIAASIIAASFTFSFWFFDSSKSSEELFSDYFYPYNNVVKPVLRGNNLTEVDKAFMFYEQKNYTKATEIFSNIPDSLLSKNTIKFFHANALLAQKKNKEALVLFTTIEKDTGKWVEQSTWYLALAYLNNNKIDVAKRYLKKIKDKKSYNYLKAEDLLKELKE